MFSGRQADVAVETPAVVEQQVQSVSSQEDEREDDEHGARSLSE